MATTQSTPVAKAVESLIENLELDDAGKARSEIALNLARRLDASQYAKAGTVGRMAATQSRELDRIIKELNDASRQAKAMSLVSSIFNKGDSPS